MKDLYLENKYVELAIEKRQVDYVMFRCKICTKIVLTAYLVDHRLVGITKSPCEHIKLTSFR